MDACAGPSDVEAKLRLCQDRLLAASRNDPEQVAELAAFFERTDQLDAGFTDRLVSTAVGERDLALLACVLPHLNISHRCLLHICQAGWSEGAALVAANFDPRLPPPEETDGFLKVLGESPCPMGGWILEKVFSPLPPGITPLRLLAAVCRSDDLGLVKRVAERHPLGEGEAHGPDQSLFLEMCRKNSLEIVKWAAEELGVALRPEERIPFFAIFLERGEALPWASAFAGLAPGELLADHGLTASLYRFPAESREWFKAYTSGAGPLKSSDVGGAPAQPALPEEKGSLELISEVELDAWLASFEEEAPWARARADQSEVVQEIANFALDENRADLAGKIAGSAVAISKEAARTRRNPAVVLYVLLAAAELPAEMRWLSGRFDFETADPQQLLRKACLGGLACSAKQIAADFGGSPRALLEDGDWLDALLGAARGKDAATRAKYVDILAWLKSSTD